jgi:hypothetical protein
VQKDSNWEPYPSKQEGTIEIEKTNEKETDKDQGSKKPGGKELPRSVRRWWPKLEIGTTNGKDKQDEVYNLNDDRTKKQDLNHSNFRYSPTGRDSCGAG